MGADAQTEREKTEKFCRAMDDWAALMSAKDKDFATAWRTVRMAIGKSCLLDRMLYIGKKPSSTPCPVHKGRWSGLHLGWPGAMWSNGQPVTEEPMLREWFDAGCRCFQHGCGCTTGWQPEPAEGQPPRTPPREEESHG